jgi:hypothetical protein
LATFFEVVLRKPGPLVLLVNGERMESIEERVDGHIEHARRKWARAPGSPSIGSIREHVVEFFIDIVCTTLVAEELITPDQRPLVHGHIMKRRKEAQERESVGWDNEYMT